MPMLPTDSALIAMSGGVDSSVAAYLVKQQCRKCIGVTMKLYHNEDIGVSSSRTCCSLDDVEDARSVAYRLGMPYYVFNFTADFKNQVIDRFISVYENGGTPNPCIDCNRYLKFGRLYDRAKELGCDYVVTGHYARIEYDEKTGRYLLKKAEDLSKDQSYVLYSLTQEQLSHTLFPLGSMTKAETRKIAEEQGFLNSDKPDSQDICFVPDGDYAAFMERYTGKAYPPGDFIDTEGNVIGRHLGTVRYTIGQRRGLGVPAESRLYVCSKNLEDNTVTLGHPEDLFSKSLIAEDFNWISIPALTEPLQLKAKTRYRQVEQDVTVSPMDDGRVLVELNEPQRAVTVGQAVVLYDGDTVVGGGTIAQTMK